MRTSCQLQNTSAMLLRSTYPLQPIPQNSRDESISNGILCPLRHFVQGGRGHKVFGHVVARKAVLHFCCAQGMVDAPQITALCTAAQDLCVPPFTHVSFCGNNIAFIVGSAVAHVPRDFRLARPPLSARRTGIERCEVTSFSLVFDVKEMDAKTAHNCSSSMILTRQPPPRI